MSVRLRLSVCDVSDPVGVQVILKLDLKATGAWALKISITFMSATDVQKENATDVEDIMRSVSHSRGGTHASSK